MTGDRWSRLLDEYEAVLEEQEALVARRGATDGDVVLFCAPDGLPAPAPELLPRLTRLSERTAELVAHATAVAATLSPGHVAPGVRSGRAQAATIDHRA